MRNIPFTAFIIVSLAVNPAQAYIDPGSGSYLIQVLIGCLLGTMISIKAFWRNIWMSLRLKMGAGRAGASKAEDSASSTP